MNKDVSSRKRRTSRGGRTRSRSLLRNDSPLRNDNRGAGAKSSAYDPGLTTGELELLSEETGVPVATLEEAGSYYADYNGKKKKGGVIQVCAGTSCRLNGGKGVETMLHRYGHDCERVYCLGFCDRSPVSMTLFEQMGENASTSVRNFAPEAITTRRIIEGPLREINEAIGAGVYGGFISALKFPPAHLIDEVEKAGARNRGGAGSLTGEKWRLAAEAESDEKYVIANGDEGDPGSYIDRVLMEEDPHTLIEGMLLCGYAIGASGGILYIRSEYPRAVEIMHDAILEAREEGYLGNDICGSGFDFDIRVFVGKASYVCSEEAVLIASLERAREEARPGSPERGQVGLHGRPTVVDTIETLFGIPFIAQKGGDAFAFFGTHATTGTKAICLNYGFSNPGIVEIEFGMTFREVIEEIGGGGRDGEPLAAVLVGGPMGTILKPEAWDFPICYEVLGRQGIRLGHGGIVAIPESADFRDLLIHYTEFMIRESCGKCVPCRVSSRAFLKAVEENRGIPELEEMLDAIEAGSLCTTGHFVPGAIRVLLREFPDRIFD